ncbi:hypothetical protein COB55_00120 [Candidatus Wolfebacteria bacterium]|nr:MAG: hypothetical protein COB55_00120 [Candidatus Wolfebacteria bacterium]
MTEIIPAIIPKSFDDLRENVSKVSSFVPLVQIDIVDGVFVPSKGWPYTDSQTNISEDTAVLHLLGVAFEVDLMVTSPEDVVLQWVDAGASRIIIHIESTDNMDKTIEVIRNTDTSVEIGIAINTDTEVDRLSEFIPKIDFVQCMGIAKIGYQGQPFDERVISQIRALKSKYADIIISVDGGVTLDTAPKLIEAGASRLVSGSAIFKSDDISTTILNFKSL